jgi:hypothetical protein
MQIEAELMAKYVGNVKATEKKYGIQRVRRRIGISIPNRSSALHFGQIRAATRVITRSRMASLHFWWR